MKELLQTSKEQLLKPLSETRRRYLLILNIFYVGLVLFFLTSEKIATGRFVPATGLYLVYVPAILINLFSAVYNLIVLRYARRSYRPKQRLLKMLLGHQSRLDTFTGWSSVGLIMFMSFCHLIGYGNPSSDAILTDFALAHALIIIAVILVGRAGAFAWFLMVIALLTYNVTKRGWDYQYHYLTPAETAKYENALADQEPWALKRKDTLENAHLNPPKITRYFNIWMVFILVSFLTAYFFGGITINILKVVPSIIGNIETAIQNSVRIELALEQKQQEVTKSAMRVVRYNEVMERLNKEIEKLDYQDKKKLAGVVSMLRQSLGKEEA